MDQHRNTEQQRRKKRPMLDMEDPPVLDKKDRARLDKNYEEETAAEPVYEPNIESDRQNDQDLTSVFGWVAVALSALSFFMAPVLFAVAGIVVGFIARQRAAPVLGASAIGLAVISLIARFFIIPMI